MDQSRLISLFCERPEKFAWFLGAGTSRSAGLPTATDIIWDLKRRFYCNEEGQDVSRQDIQSDGVKARIQSFMDSRGFPADGAQDEYGTFFEKIFGTDLDRQRRYLHAILSEERVTLTVGNRVFGALLAGNFCRVAFTTNFDTVVEKAVAEVADKSLAAFHLEGPTASVSALNNEEFPLYCKLHGDFRYECLKNLPADLQTQNQELAKCFAIAAARFGFVVAGYSGRDASIMNMFGSVLATPNPFPHGLYWTHISTSPPTDVVHQLLAEAQAKGVDARAVPIETFDTLMLRLWRNIENKPAAFDRKVRKVHITPAQIPIPPMGEGRPILRLNALPILSLPQQCNSIAFKTSKEWADLHTARDRSEYKLIMTKADAIWCWGDLRLLENAFGEAPARVEARDVPRDLSSADSLHVRRFLQDALCVALVRGKPLLTRRTRNSAYIIIDPHAEDIASLDELTRTVGKTSGQIAGLFAPTDDEHPHPEKITWAEAIRVSLDTKNGQTWLLIDPDIWIWPPRARNVSVDFMDQRRSDRFNKKYNALVDAWIRLILGPAERGSEIKLSAFESGTGAENPGFTIFNRTGFARRLTS